MLDEPLALVRRSADGDPIHAQLRAALERRQSRHLWVPADAITFTPRLLPFVYGDGRALYGITTINQRPAYWIVRACSTWCESNWGDSPTFGEFTDDILTDLEDAFGTARCGYSGSSLLLPRRERVQFCQCEECTDRLVAKWPMVDAEGGCAWWRMPWPEGVRAVIAGGKR